MFSSFGSNGSYHWWPYNVYGSSTSSGGWRFVSGAEVGNVTYQTASQSTSPCTNPDKPAPEPGSGHQPTGPSTHTTFSSIAWTDPSGTVHPFYASLTSVESDCDGDIQRSIYGGLASDGSGYSVADDGGGHPLIVDSNGTQVYPQIIDRYGNYWSSDSNGNLVDDTGRIPVLVTQNGNVVYYDVLAPNGTVNNQGTRVRYTVTSASVPVNTNFIPYDQSDIHDWTSPGLLTPVQSILLPNGSQYSFTYDGTGELSTVTLPTGGNVRCGYDNFVDSSKTENRWLTSRTVDSDPATTFRPSVVTSCANYSTGCIEHVLLHKPSGDETVYEMTLINGAWNTGNTVFAGSANGNQPLLQTTNVNQYTNGCSNASQCVGANYISQSTSTTILSPNTNPLSTQTQSFFDPSNGKVTKRKEWDYFTSSPSSTPTRETDYIYSGFDVQQVTVLDRTGNPAGKTTYGYASTATPTSGISQHGTQNVVGSYLQSVSHWTNANSSLTTTYWEHLAANPSTMGRQ